MARTGFWDMWLFVVAVAMAGFGVLMVLFGRSALFDGFNRQIDPVFWPADAPVAAADLPVAASPSEGAGVREFQGWAYGVWGATVAGLGLLAAFVVRGPFRLRQPWARNALATSILVWYALDTAISAQYGVWFNIGFNTLVLAALLLPLALTWTQFRRE
jgi:hypothetical protein